MAMDMSNGHGRSWTWTVHDPFAQQTIAMYGHANGHLHGRAASSSTAEAICGLGVRCAQTCEIPKCLGICGATELGQVERCLGLHV
mgnify:CR=1 FL=1